jgi:tetratricopeptide (TPR) repeat protein
MRYLFVCCTIALWLSGCAQRPGAASSAADVSGEQLLGIARHAERQGDTLRAQQYLLTALARGADPRRVLPWLLRSYVADGQYRSAIQRAREGLSVRADDIPLRLLLADLYRATELTAAALQEYEQVLELSPDQPRAHLELATMLHDSGADAARAEQHFRAYLVLEPNGSEAGAVRARLLKGMP